MKIINFLTIFIFFFAVHVISAAVMNSSNYSIQLDSVNFGGGLSSSTNYIQESTGGEIATGDISSSNYKIKAGYQQMSAVYLAITSISDVTLSPSINGTIAGTANGSTSFTITTDNTAGYEAYIKASSSPALISGANSFANYTPTGAVPDFTFSIAATVSEFGFTPEGTDIASNYKDNGTTCGTGSSDATDSCWNALSTTDDLIARRTSNNNPTGTATTLKFRAQNGASHVQASGSYVATTTVTAVAL